MADLEKLEAVFQYTLDHQDAWDQNAWVDYQYDKEGHPCGTTCCFAGNAALVAGYTFRWNENELKFDILDPDQFNTGLICEQVREIAAKYLELNYWQADKLFCSMNTIEKIRQIIDDIKECQNG